MTRSEIGEMLHALPEKDGLLIPILQKVQSHFGYISPEAVAEISFLLKIPESEIYGVATFYAEFRLDRPGDHSIKVCLGTSCYLKGGRRLLDHLKRELDPVAGRTTPDGRFSLETVACLGCCSRSPAMSVDNQIFGEVSPSRADAILSDLE